MKSKKRGWAWQSSDVEAARRAHAAAQKLVADNPSMLATAIDGHDLIARMNVLLEGWGAVAPIPYLPPDDAQARRDNWEAAIRESFALYLAAFKLASDAMTATQILNVAPGLLDEVAQKILPSTGTYLCPQMRAMRDATTAPKGPNT